MTGAIIANAPVTDLPRSNERSVKIRFRDITKEFAPHAGGAPANVAVAVARAAGLYEGGRKPVYMFGAACVLLAAFPAFALIYYRMDSYIWVGLAAALALGHAAMYAPQAAFYSEFFPTPIRASGVSFIQQIGALIGSVGTLAAGWLLEIANGAPWALAGYIGLGCIITIACTAALPETAPRLGRWKDLVSGLSGERVGGEASLGAK